MSLKRIAIRLLEKGAGISSRAGGEIVHRDLDHLAGVWSDTEADQFDASLSQQRKIEPMEAPHETLPELLPCSRHVRGT